MYYQSNKLICIITQIKSEEITLKDTFRNRGITSLFLYRLLNLNIRIIILLID